jgi:hypothetical protein
MANRPGRQYSGNMKVKRIVTNIAATDFSKARHFYVDVLGLSVVMDLGWIITFDSPQRMAPQISVAKEGCSELEHCGEQALRGLSGGPAACAVSGDRSPLPQTLLFVSE